MEGPVYDCDYLGYKTLPKPATSVAGLQTPIKDLYLHFRKSLQQGAPPSRSSFKVTPGGLLVALHESSGPVEMFFDLTSINLIEAVHFALLKGSEKKPKAVFAPLDENRAPVSDKAAFSLDKPFHFLVQVAHQPLLVCVLRRPKGVKALDCHVFAMDSPEKALHVQALVQQLIASGGPAGATGDGNFNRGGTRGDFIRTEFGDYNVYRGGGAGQGQAFELKDEHFRGGGGGGGFPPQRDPGLGPRGGGQPSPRETYPAESNERPRFGWSYDKPQSGDEFRRVAGQYGGETGRPVSGEMRPGNQYPGEGRPGNQYPSEGRPGNQYPGDGVLGNQYPGEGRPGNQYLGDGRGGSQYPGDRRSGEMSEERAGFRGGAPYEQVYRRGEYERAEVGHARERSGDSGDNRVTGLSRKVSTGSDHSGGGGRRYDDGGGVGVGGRGGYPPDSRYGPVSPRSEAPPKVMEKPVSPVRAALGPPFSQTTPIDSPRSPTAPFTRTSPPPGSGPSQERPAFSLSNRESRGEVAEEPQMAGKPVAKVPPHLKGVKVLPSDFRAVKLKPKTQRSESEESEHSYDNQKNIIAQYKQLQQQEQEAQQGFPAFHDRDLEKPESQPRSYNDNWNDDLPGGPRAGTGHGLGSGSGYDPQYRRYPPPEEDRRYIEQFSEEDTVLMRGYGKQQQQQQQQQQRYDDPPVAGKNRYSAPGYADVDHAQSRDWRSQSAYEMGPGQGYSRGGAPGQGRGGGSAPSSAANDDRQMGRKKDAEIASMFSNFRLQGREEGFVQDRNNFEDSLGYLP